MIRSGVAFCVFWMLAAGYASAGPVLETVAVPVEGAFVNGEDQQAQSISGIACLPEQAADKDAGTLTCLVAMDEGLAAQWVLLRLGVSPTLVVKDPVGLMAVQPKPAHMVPAPGMDAVACSGDIKKGNEHDSEGVTLLDGQFYLTGSHGCGRKQGNFKATAFLDARLPAEGGAVVLTDRLNPALAADTKMGAAFGVDIGKGGLSIEGIAGRKGRLYFGVRSPLFGQDAALVSVDAAALFDPGQDLAPIVTFAPLGGLGMRDLVALPNAGFLVLAGPTDGEAGPFRVLHLDAANKVTDLGDLPPVTGEKPEAMTLVGADGTQLRLLILNDGPVNGDPVLVTVSLP